MAKRRAKAQSIGEKMTAALDKSNWVERGVVATDRDLRLAESVLLIKLPRSYNMFQKTYGNAIVRGNAILGVAESLAPGDNAIDRTASESIRGLFKLPANCIVVMEDGRGGIYTIDGRKRVDGECPVVHWEHEIENPELQKPRLIARSFGAFVLRLEKNGYLA